MEKRLSVEDKVARCIEPILEDTPYEIYDIEFTKEAEESYLRIFIDKDDGVDLDDCERVTGLVSDPLDVTDPIAGAYFLEVSSPGVERKLRTPEHYAKVVGEKIYIKCFSPVKGHKEITGILKSFTHDEVTVTCEGEDYTFPFAKIAKANLSVF